MRSYSARTCRANPAQLGTNHVQSLGGIPAWFGSHLPTKPFPAAGTGPGAKSIALFLGDRA